MSKQLSATKKLEYLPILFNKQKGRCLYCKQPFESIIVGIIFEHLNNNRQDNRLENLALAHQACNIKKLTYLDYQIIANEQLRQNQDQVLSERKYLLEDNSSLDVSSEIAINQMNYPIVEQFITEIINTEGFILYSDALNACAFKCISRTGHGSLQSVRGYIAILTSILGPFMVTKDDKTKKKLIVKRTGT